MRFLYFVSIYFLSMTSLVNAQVYVDADHTNIIYWGRIDHTNVKAPTFAYPGVTIKARFSGTSIAAVLYDYAAHGPTTTNYFYKIIDDQEPVKIEVLAGEHSYVLASGLEQGIHTIQLIKLTEASVGKTAFKCFILDDNQSLLPITDTPDTEIEFIGDSITCGYGNEANMITNAKTGFTSINENNYNAWGYLAARQLGMRYKTIAYSGRGLYRNYSGNTKGLIPEIYDRIFPDDENSPTWNHNTSHPNIIVINLGTNDFAMDPKQTLNETQYKSAYIAFVKKLKTHHPNATIICAVGTMMRDSRPKGAKHWTRIKTYVQDVVTSLNTLGLPKIHYLEMPAQVAPYGEDWHPSNATHTKMANQLVDFVNKITKVTSLEYKICNWLDNKKAAVALTFDDFSNGHPKIVIPELKSKNINATFYINTSKITNWNPLKVAHDNGNEIGNHSKNHKKLILLTPNEISEEIRHAKTVIEQQISNSKILTFAYPFGLVNNVVLDSVVNSDHIAARGVAPSSNNYTYNFAPKETHYFRVLTYPMGTDTTLSNFKNEIINIIRGGGFLNFLYHSVNSPNVVDNNYQPVSKVNFKAQLDALLEKQDKVWICTFSQAIQYHKQKKTAKLIEVSPPFEDKNTWKFLLTDNLRNDLYFQPLTIQVKIPKVVAKIIKVRQGENELKFKIINKKLLQFNAVPDDDIISISISKKSNQS